MPDRTGPTTGERNRNYLNVKNNRAKPWQRVVGTDERGHAIFEAPEWGLRAAIITLRTYWFSYGLRTISGILQRWAPTSDTIGSRPGAERNDPNEYAAFVAKRMRISAGQDLQLFHPDKRLNNVANLQALVEAMAEFENRSGFDVPDDEFIKALYLVDPDRAPGPEPGASAPTPTQPAAPETHTAPVAPAEDLDALLARLAPELRQLTAYELLEKLMTVLSPRPPVVDVVVEPPPENPAPPQQPVEPPQPAQPATPPSSPEIRRGLPVGGFFASDTLLRRIMQVSGFALPPDDDLVFFGFRGALPFLKNYREFALDHILRLAELNYRNPRCTLGLWKPKERLVALFPGSTIPTSRYVLSAIRRNGEGTNELLPGYYAFERGMHRGGSPNGHQAFRQKGNRIFRRTADDGVYEPEDGAQVGNPFDNLHAAFGDSVEDDYSSAGCQVVVGQPKSQRSARETGDWAVFRQTAYASGQQVFRYILFEATTAATLSEDLRKPAPLQLRCGAEKAGLPSPDSDLIERAQSALGLEGPDGNYGAKTSLAVLKFQLATFGAREADGVLGPRTADALKLEDWPRA